MALAKVWHLAEGRIGVVAGGPDEMPAAAGLLDEASAWLEGRGLTGWPRPFPASNLAADLARGNTYLATDGTTPAGTFSLYRTDVLFWGERPDEPPGHALYLHKLAVGRRYAGLGREVATLAERLAREGGAACLRLDCAAANSRIRRYYEATGFEFRGEIYIASLDFRAALYEKSLR